MSAAYAAGALDKARALGSRLARVAREIDRLYGEWA
jgi:hypothetical protein